ncbi:MAG: DUF2380 domain-containing protein [Bradyrhizobium sp.]
MRSGTLARILIAAFVTTDWVGAARAAQSAAIFPFEIFDTSGEPPQPDRNERLAMATRVLSEALAKTGRYSAIDLGPFSAEVAATAPRYQCGDCFLPVARKAGAAVAVASVAHKVSTLVTSMDIWIIDASSGASVAHLGGQIRGDTAEAYEHGVRFLVRNRLPDEDAPGKGVPPK